MSEPEPSAIFAPGSLTGRSVLVTGGGTNLGRASVAELRRCGADVVICGRREEVLREACDELGCSYVVADVREPEGCANVVDTVLERHGRLDVLVNNAGGQYFVPAESIEPKGWRAVTRLNVGATLTMSTTAYERAMREAGAGTIVNVTLSPHHGLAGMTHSSAARAAVEGLTRELAAEWASDGVCVCAAAAGHFDTESLKKYPIQVRRSVAHSVPLGRMGREEEYAWLIALLSSPLGARFSGSIVTLDGARDNWSGPWPPETLRDEEGDVPTEERREGGAPH